jgi:hypothetical protein
MEILFNWIGTLSQTEIVSYSILVCGLMLFIPIAQTFLKLIKKLVFMKRMSIKYFSHQFYPIELVLEKNGKNINKIIETPDFVIEGSKVLLHWEVEGALSVSLYPKHGKIKGNMAEVIINRNNHTFVLVVKGLFSREKVSVSIPLDKIKTLVSESISTAKILSESPLMVDIGITQNETLNKTFTKTLSKETKYTKNVSANYPFIKLPYYFASKLVHREAEELFPFKVILRDKLERNKILKCYTFSTKKYNQINQFKNQNS